MRLLLIPICLSLAACGGKSESDAGTSATATTAAAVAGATTPAAATVPPVAAPATAAASRALLDAYLQAWNDRDGDKVAAFMADDVVAFDSLLGNLSNGRAEARSNVIDMYLRAVPDGQWTLRGEPIVSEAGFSYEWTLTGVNMGNWATYLRGKGQKINFKGITIVRTRDGKIVYQANYFDTNALGTQAGW
jgi:steroid delta-isomerase-like uncharacterized protein